MANGMTRSPALTETNTGPHATTPNRPKVGGPAAERLLRELKERDPIRNGILGDSPAVRVLFDQVLRLSRCQVPVLVVGEIGAGKEAVARAIHQNSDRSVGRFVAEAAANLRDPVLLSRVFGHQRGAFTGATTAVSGILDEADGGTLFLDEVADLSPAAQACLVRCLETGEYRPLGSAQVRHSDFRLIASTSADLRALVGTGNFRSDLYFRLRGAVLRVPALRERFADILPLAEQFLGERAQRERRAPNLLADCAREALVRYGWPGNVRELRQELAHAMIQADGGEITVAMLQFLRDPAPLPLPPEIRPQSRSLRSELGAFEESTIREAVRMAGGNKAEAARRLGITRRTLYRRLRQLEGTSVPISGLS